MIYTITDNDGVTVVRAELRKADDFDELAGKLAEYRDKHYCPKQKEEPNE